MKIFSSLHLVILLLFTFSGTGNALDNSHAIKGLSSVKIIADVNIGNPERLALKLSLIDQTYRELVASGVEPIIVIAYRGGASKYVTKGEEYVATKNLHAKKRVQEWVGKFAERGVRQEQCAIAAKLLSITAGSFLPEIEVVQNGYISIIGYQQQGFALLPMD